MTTAGTATAREVLLERIVTDVAEHGIGDRSLRQTSRLRWDPATACSCTTSVRGRAWSRRSSSRSSGRNARCSVSSRPRPTILTSWSAGCGPGCRRRLRPFVRLFFEALATAGDTGTDRTAPWLNTAEDVTGAVDVAFDPVDVRLGVAVTRGLARRRADDRRRGERHGCARALPRALATRAGGDQAGLTSDPDGVERRRGAGSV